MSTNEDIKNEISIANQDGKIIKVEPIFSFQRVDFNNPATIRDYGQSLLEEMAGIVAKASEANEQEALPQEELKDKVDNLKGFGEKLDKLEVKRIAQKKGLAKVLNNIRKNILKIEPKNLSYTEELKKYYDNIDSLTIDVQTMYEQSNNVFDLFNNFINSMVPYLVKLSNVYEVGLSDLEEYVLEVEKLQEQLKLEPENANLKREVTLKLSLIDTFRSKLYALQKSGIVINQVVTEWNERQVNALNLASTYQSYLTVDSNVMKINGASLIGAKKQKEEAELLTYLVDGMNDALLQGSKSLTDAISSVNELTKDGNIKFKTIKTREEYIQKGFDLLVQGRKEKREMEKKNSEALNMIVEDLQNYGISMKEQFLLDTNDDSHQKIKK